MTVFMISGLQNQNIVQVYEYKGLCPWRVRGKNMRRSRGTVAVYFKVVVQCNNSIGQTDVALSEKKRKYKNLLTGIISAL